MSGNTVLYQLVFDDGVNYWDLGSFHDRPTPEAIVERANTLARDAGYREVFRIREVKVLRADSIPVGAPTEDFIRALSRASDTPALEYWADEALLHLQAIRSAPEDYDPERLARWGVER